MGDLHPALRGAMVLRAVVVSLLCGIASSYSAPHVDNAALAPVPHQALNNLQARAGNGLVPGAKVTLKGLVADASLNGQTFEVMAVDKEKAVVKVGDENVGVEPANFDLVQETSGKSEPAKPEEAKPEEAKQQPAPTASFATANELAKTRVDQETAPPTTHYAEGTHVVLEGLKTTAYNGRKGVVVKEVPDSKPRRFEVAVDDLYDHLALKVENIKLLPKNMMRDEVGGGSAHAQPRKEASTMDVLRQKVQPAGQYMPSEKQLMALDDDQLRDIVREVMVENQVLRARIASH